jgi:enterochelin esterase-like enzyme
MHSSDIAGKFDPIGWALTAVSILVATVAVTWAGAVLAAAIRTWLRSCLALLAELLRARRRDRRLIGAPFLLLLSAILTAVCLPVLGDVFNYGTDVRMRAGAQRPVPLFGAATDGATTAGGPSGGSQISAGSPPGSGPNGYPHGLVDGPAAGVLVSPGALSAQTPWAKDPPSGPSRSVDATLPGPWLTGRAAELEVYLPPGYDSQTSRRYPVVYELPYGKATWDKAMGLSGDLDTLVTSGQLPPMIVVFASTSGGPYQDPECSDSFDKREWFDRYLADELVPWVDRSFRTIPRAAARTALGASKGGYCAASALTHHPDLFGNAISFSGYFVAGLQSSQTIGADLVFGRNAGYEAEQSPIDRLATLGGALRKNLFMVMESNPLDPLYGAQMLAFARALGSVGVPMSLISTPLGHSWNAQRQYIPIALGLVAGREEQVLGSGLLS